MRIYQEQQTPANKHKTSSKESAGNRTAPTSGNIRHWKIYKYYKEKICISVIFWPHLTTLLQSYLSCWGERGSVVQQHGSDILVSFTGSQVKGGVAWGGGGVGRGAALQQLLDDVHFPQSTGDVQRRLVVLQKKDNKSICLQYLILVCF